MYDDLIVVTYPRTAEAIISWLRLHLLRDSQFLGIDSALIVSINEPGQAYIPQASDLARFPACRAMRLLGSVARGRPVKRRINW